MSTSFLSSASAGEDLACLSIDTLRFLAVDAVQAARPGLQPPAWTATQTGRRECSEIMGTAKDEDLTVMGVE